jgi:iron complex outermembrane receptor protein
MRRIKNYKKSRILLAFSTCVGATLSAPLIAEEAPLKLADVVVTATKTGEASLQEVPVSISVMSEDDLQESGANNIEDLVQQTPGLGINRNGPASRLYMRGIGTNLDFIGSDPSVTVHVDGVYQSRTVTALDDFLGVERVEVLRGPQGTLYGRNSIGGTVNVISKLPQAELERVARFDVGSDSSRRFSTYISGALNQDETVLGNISLMKSDHAPYVTNINTPESPGLFDEDNLAGRGTLRYLVGQKGEVILRADYSNNEQAPIPYKSTGLAVDGSPAAGAGPVNIPSDSHEVDFSFQDPKFKQINKGFSTEVIWQLTPDWAVTSLTAYRDLGFSSVEDTDGSNIESLYTGIVEEQEQLSEELRFNYKSDRLKLVTGLYFLDENHESDLSINVGSASSRNFDTSNDTTAYAIFGQGTYGLTKKLNATLGLRYSNEEKKFSNDHVNISLPAFLVDYNIDKKESWDAWSPKAAVDYTFDDGPMVYGSVSRGFKSGGFNLTSEDAEYDPEFVWSYEIGVKEEWLNKSLRTNVALFYYDYTDLQVSSFDQPGTLLISNAADADIQGLELELSWMPSYDWMLDFNYAYLDATYKDYQTPQGLVLVDVSDNDLNSAPAHKFNTAVQYFQSVEKGTFSYRLEYFWQDKSYFTAFNEDTSSQGAYGIWNARINFIPLDESWELQIYGENLGDKAYSTSSREFPAAGAATGVTKDINPPRTFGARLTYNFM